MHIAYLDYFCVTVSLLCSAFVVAIFYPIFSQRAFLMIDQRALDIAVRKFPDDSFWAARTRTEQITAWKLRHLIRAGNTTASCGSWR